MSQLEIGFDPDLPEELAQALRSHLAERWPDLSWTSLRLPAERRDARDGPLLVLLRPETSPPPGDPGELAVVRWDKTADARGRESLFLQVDLEIARITTGRSGASPERDVSPPPREMTRRALLQIPLPLGRPLPAVPWLESELCVRKNGCRLCGSACPEQAVSDAGTTVRIDPERCTGCGACVATCPTGALTDAYLADGQWQAALAVLAAVPGAPPLTLRCPVMEQEVPEDTVSLPVGCIGEAGWPQLLASLEELGQLPQLRCERSDCRLHAQAEAALRRLGRLQSLRLGWDAEQARARETGQAQPAGRRAHFARSLRNIAKALPEEVKEQTWPALGWTVQMAAGETRCTLCSGCVHACPAGAFAIEEGARGTALKLDAALCTGCGVCSDICPEKALEVSEATVGDLLRPQEIFRAEKALCKGCGLPYETPSFVAALRARMETAGFSGLLVDRLDYCPECRAALQG